MKKKYNIQNLSFLVKGELVFSILSFRISEMLTNKYKDLYPLAYLHLMYIKNVEGISQVELSKVTHTNQSTLHRNVLSLINKGYIIKKVGYRANENELYLTEKGLNAVESITDWISSFEKEMNFSEETLQNLNNTFSSIIMKYKKEI